MNSVRNPHLNFGLEPYDFSLESGAFFSSQVELSSQLQILGYSDKVLLLVVLMLVPQCLPHLVNAFLERPR